MSLKLHGVTSQKIVVVIAIAMRIGPCCEWTSVFMSLLLCIVSLWAELRSCRYFLYVQREIFIGVLWWGRAVTHALHTCYLVGSPSSVSCTNSSFLWQHSHFISVLVCALYRILGRQWVYKCNMAVRDVQQKRCESMSVYCSFCLDSSTLKMEAIHCFETLVNFYQTLRRYNLERFFSPET
jgi:hypothetical protein